MTINLDEQIFLSCSDFLVELAFELLVVSAVVSGKMEDLRSVSTLKNSLELLFAQELSECRAFFNGQEDLHRNGIYVSRDIDRLLIVTCEAN